jgi:hypothetical protein
MQVAFCSELQAKTLVMLFQKPSLRTRVSFEVSGPLTATSSGFRSDAAVQVGMTQLGGHAIFYSVADSPLGEKETMSDTAKARAPRRTLPHHNLSYSQSDLCMAGLGSRRAWGGARSAWIQARRESNRNGTRCS